MNLRPLVRGLVWMAIGAAVYVYSAVSGTPIVVRGTQISWGLVVIGVGLVLAAWDLARARKNKQ